MAKKKSKTVQKREDSLSDEDRDLAHELFARGPGALRDSGWTDEQINNFLQRPEVQKEVNLLFHEYESREAMEARVVFNIRRRLRKSAHKAISVLDKSLDGPTYKRDLKGHVEYDEKGRPLEKEPEPTRTQFNAAQEVLDRLGVVVPEGVSINLDDIFDTAPMKEVPDELTQYEDEEERAASYERLRTAMEELAPHISEIRDTIDRERQKRESAKTRKEKYRNKKRAKENGRNNAGKKKDSASDE